jgi:hypothetical protein
MQPIRTIATLATVAVLLAVVGTPPSTAEARNPNSTKQTHYYSPPILLLPYIEQLRVCVADVAKTGSDRSRQSLYFPESMLKEINVYGMDGALLLATEAASLEPDRLGVCTEIATDELGSPDIAPPAAILAELILSAPAESKSVPLVTFGTAHGLLLPAVQADAPMTPGRFSNYRPQFYFRTTDVGTLTHVFGPFTLTAGQEVEICAADAAALPGDPISLNPTEIAWTVEVHATARGGDTTLDDVVVVKEVDSSGPKANCTGAITFDDILRDQGSDPGPVESLVVVVLLYASASPETQAVPMATGWLKSTLDEPEPVPLLLPAVQAAREAAR